jgi:hypothetical protein
MLNLNIMHIFISGRHSGLLLGDSGYPLKKYLLTPYRPDPREAHKKNYNRAHKRTRVLVEHTIGIFKRRFPPFHYGLRIAPDRVCVMFAAYSVIHNIAVERNLPIYEDEELRIVFDDDNDANPQSLPALYRYRDQFAARHFAE